MRQLDDLDINTENAGEQWLELKAAALSLKLSFDNYQRFFRASLQLNVILFVLVAALLAFLFPHVVLATMAVGGALWLLGVTLFAAMLLDCYLRDRREQL